VTETFVAPLGDKRGGQSRSSAGASADPNQARRAVVACHDCDLLYPVRRLAAGESATCSRCGAVLYKGKADSVERALTLTISGLILFVLANAYPFMVLEIEGREQVNTLFTGVGELYSHGMWELALLVLMTSIGVPLMKLSATTYVLLPLWLGRRLPGAAKVFRWVEIMHPWAMMEVYLLGVLVAYVNLTDLGSLELGTAVFAFAALILIMVAAEASLDPREVWDQLGRPNAGFDAPQRSRRSVVACHSCQFVGRLSGAELRAHPACPRCGASLHLRKPDSVARTWALLITAAILYVPANVYPVMTVISFGSGQPDTILSGVKHLIEGGLWPLAALVFFASVAVPALKVLGLSFLLISVQTCSRWRPRDRTRLYRVIEGVGRWSMIDVFMVSILVALVKLGSIATIEPGIGASAFAAVVILTMIASMSFDPRLIWDAAGTADDRRAAQS